MMLKDERGSGTGESALSTACQWLTPGRFAVMLGLLVFAAFPQLIIGSHSFAYRDAGLFGYPVAHYHRESFWQGEIPLWNPYNDFGTPFLAQWNTMVLYPPSLIYLLLPMPWSLSLFCLIHLFMGGLGMYVLTNAWTSNRLAAGVAGIGFAFSGLTLNCLMWPNYTASLACMPWVVWAVIRGWQMGGRAILLGSAVGALQMLSGTPEVILFTWLILAVAWMWTSVRTWSEAWVSGRRAAILILVVGALSAAQLLPFLELLSHSGRDSSVEQGQWPLPVWGWANLFVPMFRTHPTGCGVHFQYDQLFTSSIYSGICVMLLAGVALICSRDRRVWLFTTVAIISLVFSMGEKAGLYPLVKAGFPQIGIMRYTSKFVIAMTFAWPIVAAFGLAALCRAETLEAIRKRFWILASVGASLALVVAAIVMFARWSPYSGEDWSKTLANGGTRIALMAAVGGSLFFLTRLHRNERHWLIQCVILMLVWLDSMSHLPQQNPTLDREALTIQVPKDLSPLPRLGESRAALTMDARLQFQRCGTSNLTHTFLCLRNGLYANLNLVQKIPKADGYYALFVREPRDVEHRLFLTDYDVRPGLARFVGISQLTSPTNLMQWEPRSDYMPLVTAGQVPVFANTITTLYALMTTNFNPERIVFLPEAAATRVVITNWGKARVVSADVRAHRIEAQVEATAPSLVVVAQTHYPGWRSYVDGRPVELWRANHAFQAVEVPAGVHRVELVYEDPRFALGGSISGLALFGVLGGCVALRKRTADALVRDTTLSLCPEKEPTSPKLL